MNKICVVMTLLASTQLFGWRINFDPKTYKHTFEVLTFESDGDYRRMLTQISVSAKINDFLGVIAPLVGKLGSETVGSAKKPGDAEEGLKYSEIEIELIKASINASTQVVQKMVASGWFTGIVKGWTKEGYTIDLIEAFKSSADGNTLCRDAASLKNHWIHPIKINKPIFFIIVDKTTEKVVYADWGLAYGDFAFTIETIKAEDGTDQVTVGGMTELSPSDGAVCK